MKKAIAKAITAEFKKYLKNSYIDRTSVTIESKIKFGTHVHIKGKAYPADIENKFEFGIKIYSDGTGIWFWNNESAWYGRTEETSHFDSVLDLDIPSLFVHLEQLRRGN